VIHLPREIRPKLPSQYVRRFQQHLGQSAFGFGFALPRKPQ
jgi:hypothetical protein